MSEHVDAEPVSDLASQGSAATDRIKKAGLAAMAIMLLTVAFIVVVLIQII